MAIQYVKGRAYYYRKRRVGGRVVAEYLGPADAPAALGARLERLRDRERAERDREQIGWFALVDGCVDGLLDRQRDATITRVGEALTDAGYHRPRSRHYWRRRRPRPSGPAARPPGPADRPGPGRVG